MRVVVTGTRPLSSRLHTWTRALWGSGLRIPEHVVRQEIPYWQQRGWMRAGDVYTGTYQTPYGSFRGLIEERSGGHFNFYIFDIPAALRWSSHWPCFQTRGSKGHLVHMGRRPADISSGILTIERLLTESLQPSPLRRFVHDLTRTWRQIRTGER